MVRLTDAIGKVQGQTTSQPRRPRSTSQSKQQDQQSAQKQQTASTSSSKKQAPICITGDKLSLNYQEISSLLIDRQGFSSTQQKALAFQFAKVKKLFLSHNNLGMLDGIANFPNLTHLSLSHNRLANIDELAKIGSASAAHGTANNASKLLCLAIKGNYFLERHPDYKALVIRHFVNLRELDSVPLNQAAGGSQQISLRAQIREGISLKHSLIPFLLKMDNSIRMLASHLDGTTTNFEKIELIQRWNQLFNQKDYLQRGKIPSKVIQASQLRDLIRQIDGTVLGGIEGSSAMKVSKSQLHDLFEWLYQEIILKLSTELKSTDLVKYLNYTVLQKYPQLADYLNLKHQIDASKQLSQLDQRQVERLCTLLERDPQISLEMLLAEQLSAFYELQPELSSVQDYTADIRGGAIEVISDLPQQQQQQQYETEQFNSTKAIGGPFAAAFKDDANVTPSPNTNTQRKRLLVENSGSSFDHPLILKSQQELQDHSMSMNPPATNQEAEIEFSFREKQQNADTNKPPTGLQKFSQAAAPPQDDHSLNEQSFLVSSKQQQLCQEDKHQDSPLRRTSPSPAMKSFFKIKQSVETEILPARPPTSLLTDINRQPLLADLHQQKVTSLKMNIPKNYFNKAGDVPNEKGSLLGGGLDTLGQNSRGAISDSFQLSGNDPILAARGNNEALPDQQVQTQQGRRVLAKFLEAETNREQLQEAKAFLQDKVLTQFPIFALNEDYMRAMTMIIMDKIERAQTIVKQISVQIYPATPPPEEALNRDITSLQHLPLDESSVLEQPVLGVDYRKRNQLTSAEKQKLSLIKQKLHQKKERSRSVTFNETAAQQSTGNRSRSKGSNNSRDSCFSPVNRRRENIRRHSRSRQSNNSQQQDSGSRSRGRVFGSELLREQTMEHTRLTDKQNAQLWVRKKQIRSKFALKMKKIGVMLELAEQRTVQQAYYHWLRFAQKMHQFEHYIRQRRETTHREKAFYFWIASYRQSVELTSGLRALQIKQKIWFHLDINRKQAQLNRARVTTYCRQKLLLKSFYGFLKILELRREEKRKAQQQRKLELQQQQQQLQLQEARGQSSPLAAEPVQNQTTNIYKRNSSRKTMTMMMAVQDENNCDNGGLGLINVKPVIDKKIEGVYDDLDGIYDQTGQQHQQRNHYDSKVSITPQQHNPLLNAVRSQQTFTSVENVCDDTQYQQQVQFCDKTAYTNTLVQRQKANKSLGSAYFTKQVNFFKSGNSSSKTFVQSKQDSTSTLQQKHKSKSRSRSRSRDHSLNTSKRSILKKVYGGDQTNTNSIRWGINNNTTTTDRQRQNSMMSQTDEQQTLLEHSFGKLMSDRNAAAATLPNNESSSCIDFEDKAAQTSINEASVKSKRQRSRSRSGKAVLQKTHESTATLNAELSSFLTFKTVQVNTTMAKTKSRTVRASSRSMDKNRLNCGNLSRSIQDSKPKGYEKTTASYVSKFIGNNTSSVTAAAGAAESKQSSSQMFKHLKNATMGGNGDFFKGTTTGQAVSASTKKQYRKMLVK